MNDERPIEKLLRRYAKKRSDAVGAPVKPHPATRRLLQGEVARTFPKGSTDERGGTTLAQILAGWRARWIWAVPVLVVVGLGVWMWSGSDEKAGDQFELAQKASFALAPKGDNLLEPMEAAPATPLPSLVSNQSSWAFADAGNRAGKDSGGLPAETPKLALDGALYFESRLQTQGDSLTVSGLAVASQDEGGLKLEAGRVITNAFAGVFVDDLEGQSALPPSTLAQPPIVARAASSTPAVAGADALVASFRSEASGAGERDKARVYSQGFINRAPAAGLGKKNGDGGGAPVLASFRVEQSGNQLRVIDGDGSTYLGEMNLAVTNGVSADRVAKKSKVKPDLADNETYRKSESAPATLSEPLGAQNFTFRVTGTNRTLKQQVVFTGNFVALSNALSGVPGNLPLEQLPLQLTNSVINGRAQYGAEKEIEINAVPVSP